MEETSKVSITAIAIDDIDSMSTVNPSFDEWYYKRMVQWRYLQRKRLMTIEVKDKASIVHLEAKMVIVAAQIVRQTKRIGRLVHLLTATLERTIVFASLRVWLTWFSS